VGRLVVRVDDAPADAVHAALAALPGVVHVAVEPPDGDAGTAFTVLAPAVAPVQREVARTIVGAGWTLLELRATAPDLEDLFVRLVGAPPAGEA
jgi:hypothetical protein